MTGDIVEIPVEFVSAAEVKRLRAIVHAAEQVVQSLRDDGWSENDFTCLREGLSELMRLIPANTHS